MSPEQVRERVLVTLAVMSQPELMAVSADLPPGRVGYELSRLWFEQVYAPGLWTVDGLRGDRDAKAEEAFEAAFDEEELGYLERFNRFIELRLEMTPAELRAAGEIDSDRWAGVVRDARNTLDLIEPGFRADRRRISDVLRLEDHD